MAGPPRRAAARARPALALAAALQLLPAAAVDPACECLNWKEVYASKRARCGEGAELWPSHQRVAVQATELHDMYEAARIIPACDDFYRRLDNNYCANIGHMAPSETQWFGGTWCYVSSECQDLAGGRRLGEFPPSLSERAMGYFQGRRFLEPGNVSWKICTPSTELVRQDTQLRDLPLEEVFALSDRLELDAGLALKHSLWNSWVFWHQIEHAWAGGEAAELPEVLRDSMARGRPIIVDTKVGGGGDLLVVRGRELHVLEYRPGPRCGPTKYCRRVHVNEGLAL